LSAIQPRNDAGSARGWIADIAVLITLKLIIGAYALLVGFSHVSDDDYARTVIAQQFAVTPRFDPSATSWLPLPFWLVGAAMATTARSLATARAVAVGLGAASTALPYVAMRVAQMQRWPALLATAVAMALPWNAWLGVATVPEGWIGALLAGAIVSMANDGARPWSAAALLAASLSRYEAWPACAVCALICATAALRSREGCHRSAKWEALWAAVALSGPVLWMAWNAHAHGSAVHFLARVSTFRRATGAANLPLGDKLLGYPRALVAETPEAAILGLVGGIGLFFSARLRARWSWSAASAAAIMAFLIEGDVHDGAPTHHPERALSALWWILIGLGIDAIAGAIAARRKAQPPLVALGIAAATLGWCASLPLRWRACPGNTDAERRDVQIARGRDMRARGVLSAEITPCAYEHFALLAAWAEPERARLNPPLHVPPTADCPRVVER